MQNGPVPSAEPEKLSGISQGPHQLPAPSQALLSWALFLFQKPHLLLEVPRGAAPAGLRHSISQWPPAWADPPGLGRLQGVNRVNPD